MRYVRLIAVLLFGLLHLYAGAVQHGRGEKRENARLLMLGGAVAAAGGICGMFLSAAAGAAVLLGSVLLCCGAYLNGRAAHNVHIVHHVQRAVTGALLAVWHWAA